MLHALPFEELDVSAHRQRSKHQSNPSLNLAKLDYQPVMAIHRDTQAYAEENMYSLLQGQRTVMYGPTVMYELKNSNRNASQLFEGIYMCSMERRQDKMVILSSITLYGKPSPLPFIPQVEFVSCEGVNYIERQRILTLTRDRETCIRCRAIGFPRPVVGIYRENMEIRSGPFITVSKYINVAEGGLTEATYVLHSHFALELGQHSCRAVNDQGSTSIHFRVMY